MPTREECLDAAADVLVSIAIRIEEDRLAALANEEAAGVKAGGSESSKGSN